LEKRGLRLPHFAVLAGLSDFGPLAQHALADRLGLNRSHLVGYLDELERRDLVGRERDPDDRRRQRVTLTEAGKALTGELKREAGRSQDVLLAELSAKERETLISLLRRVVVADDRAQAGTE
ncbi:MarR family transcriptional regulator, partial [Amycolatopsis sp. NPDC000740]